MKIGRILGLAAVCAVGVPLGFFTVINALFTDSSGSWDYVLVLLVTAVAYMVAAAVAAFALRATPVSVAIALAAPAVIMAVLYTLREPGVLPIAALELAAVAATSLSGAAAGAHLRGLVRGTDRTP